MLQLCLCVCLFKKKTGEGARFRKCSHVCAMFRSTPIIQGLPFTPRKDGLRYHQSRTEDFMAAYGEGWRYEEIRTFLLARFLHPQLVHFLTFEKHLYQKEKTIKLDDKFSIYLLMYLNTKQCAAEWFW